MIAAVTIYPHAQVIETGVAFGSTILPSGRADGLYMAATALTNVVITTLDGVTKNLGLVPIGTFIPIAFTLATFTPVGGVIAVATNRGTIG